MNTTQGDHDSEKIEKHCYDTLILFIVTWFHDIKAAGL